MTKIDSLIVFLMTLALVLLASIAGAALAAYLVDQVRASRERRNLRRCVEAAKREAGLQ